MEDTNEMSASQRNERIRTFDLGERWGIISEQMRHNSERLDKAEVRIDHLEEHLKSQDRLIEEGFRSLHAAHKENTESIDTLAKLFEDKSRADEEMREFFQEERRDRKNRQDEQQRKDKINVRRTNIIFGVVSTCTVSIFIVLVDKVIKVNTSSSDIALGSIALFLVISLLIIWLRADHDASEDTGTGLH